MRRRGDTVAWLTFLAARGAAAAPGRSRQIDDRGPAADGARARIGVATLLAALALAFAHGRRIVENLARPQWEDGLFFRYTRDHVHTLFDCFRLPGPYPGLYRPLTTNLYYFLGLRVFGEQLIGYHLVGLLLVVLNAVLAYRIAFRLLPGRWALLAPILFASRLANVEVVTHTCEFQSLFSVFWALLSIDWFMGRRLRWSAAGFALALASKETALVVPAILLAYQLSGGRPVRYRDQLGHLAIAALWVVALTLVHHRPTGFRYDPSPPNLLGNLAAYLLAFCNLLVSPLDAWIMSPLVSTAAGWRVTRAAMAALLMLDLATIARATRGRVMAFGFAWFVIATLPAAVFQGRLFMRYGYFGYAGLSISVCAACAWVGDLLRSWRGARAAPQTAAG